MHNYAFSMQEIKKFCLLKILVCENAGIWYIDRDIKFSVELKDLA